MDAKARSRPMREILTRINELSRGLIEVKIFGDKVILDEMCNNTFFAERGTTTRGLDSVFEQFKVDGTCEGRVCGRFVSNFGGGWRF